MKILQKRPGSSRYFYIAFSCLTLLSFTVLAQQTLSIFFTHWLTIPILLYVFFSKQGKQILSHDALKSTLPLWKACLFTYILQIALLMIFYGINVILPQLSSITRASSMNPIDLATLFNAPWGYYPWGFYTLFACVLGYLCFHKHAGSLLSELIAPKLRNKPLDDISAAIDFYVRMAISASLCTSLMFTILSIALWFTNYLKTPILSGVNLPTLATTTLLFNIVNSRWWNRSIRLSTQHLSIASTVILFMSFMVIFILSMNLMTPLITKALPLITSSQYDVTHPIYPHWKLQRHLFIGLWWLVWTPLISGFIAYFFRGRRLRTLILGSLLPLMISFAVLQHFPTPPTSLLAGTLCTTLGTMIILSYCFLPSYRTYVYRATFPTRPIKQRNPFMFIRALCGITGLLTMSCIVANIFALNILLGLITLPLLGLLLIAHVGIRRGSC